jgi:hypothetical protein
MTTPLTEPSTVLTRDVIVSISALAAALVAFLGVNAWRRQLKGTTEYQNALKVLRALYAVRESVIEARDRFILPTDAVQQPPATGPEEFRVRVEARSYQRRLVRVGAARGELLLAQQEALAVWGDPAKEALEDLLEAIADLFTTYELYFDEEIALARRRDQEGKDETRDAENLVMRRVLYSALSKDGKDPFGERIARAVARAEEFYRARLK